MKILLKRITVWGFLIALVLVGAVYLYLSNPAWVLPTAGSPGDGAGSFEQGRVNIALLGFDRSEDRDELYTIFRPDTIMIASLNFEAREVCLVNIPRDSYVRIAGTDFYDKINHAYAHGYNRGGAGDRHASGISTTLRTIEEFLGGVPVHYYVSLDMDAVVEIVDRVGGIYYDVEHPVRAEMGRGRVLVDQGYQLLDGEKFLHYVRDRSVGGDTGRSQRQQQVLISALSQLKRQGRLKDIPSFYRSAKENMETNLSPVQLASLGLFGIKVNPGTIKAYIFHGSIQFAPNGDLDISYVVIDEAARLELIREIFGVTVEARPQISLPGRRPAPPEIPAEPEDPAAEPAVPEPGDDPVDEEPPESGESGETEQDSGSVEPGPGTEPEPEENNNTG